MENGDRGESEPIVEIQEPVYGFELTDDGTVHKYGWLLDPPTGVDARLDRFNLGAMLFGPVHAAFNGQYVWLGVMVFLDLVYALPATYLFYQQTSELTVYWIGFYLFPPLFPSVGTFVLLPLLIWRFFYGRVANKRSWDRLMEDPSGRLRTFITGKAAEAPSADEGIQRFLGAQRVWTVFALGVALGWAINGQSLNVDVVESSGPGWITP